MRIDDAKRQLRLDDSNLDIDNITIGAALGFLDFRLPSMNWRDGRPELARWFAVFDALPVVAATMTNVAIISWTHTRQC